MFVAFLMRIHHLALISGESNGDPKSHRLKQDKKNIMSLQGYYDGTISQSSQEFRHPPAFNHPSP